MSEFENFVNLELPKRIATNENPLHVKGGMTPVTTGIGLLTEFIPHTVGGLSVDFISELTDPDQWTSASGRVFIKKGDRVTVIREGIDLRGVYWLREDDFTDINSWERVGNDGNGISVRREFFTDQNILVIDDVLNFPIVNIFVEDDVGRHFLFGEYMFGESIFTQEFELGYLVPDSWRTAYNPVTHQLTITLLEISSGVVVITE